MSAPLVRAPRPVRDRAWFNLLPRSRLSHSAVGWAAAWEARREKPAPVEGLDGSCGPRRRTKSRRRAAIVRFEKSRQESAGVRLGEVRTAETEASIAVTGKLAVDEDRLAHIYSMVEGVLREALR
jgi:hypothetical protein